MPESQRVARWPAEASHDCRSCGTATVAILDLGRTPLANALLTPSQLGQPEPTYPLVLVFCPGCTLVQITETVPPEQLFRHYLYFSSFSDTMLRHARELVDHVIATRRLGADALVIEIASNDGYLLQNYCERGIRVLGIEPAQNVAAVAESRGVRTLSRFFGRDVAHDLLLRGERADVIHAHNVLAHVADANEFMAAAGALLKPDGVAIIEVPYVRDMIDRLEFDTIYHEHLCYFSLTAVNALVQRHGLVVTDVEHVPIHGGTLRIYLGHDAGSAPSDAVTRMLADEEACGITSPAYYRDFGNRVEALRHNLRELLHQLKRDGHRLAAYGASAKGTTLLNYCDLGADELDFVADRSTVKQGHYTPGTHLPVVPPEQLLTAQPDYVLLLTWNFVEEILAQQAEYRARGGKFIVPIPELVVR